MKFFLDNSKLDKVNIQTFFLMPLEVQDHTIPNFKPKIIFECTANVYSQFAEKQILCFVNSTSHFCNSIKKSIVFFAYFCLWSFTFLLLLFQKTSEITPMDIPELGDTQTPTPEEKRKKYGHQETNWKARHRGEQN